MIHTGDIAIGKINPGKPTKYCKYSNLHHQLQLTSGNIQAQSLRFSYANL
ncbi:MAG: hypothetical protein IPL21_10340 [Saprospirales bacterium]|nr:hypothetical protein [Saprospirales bacterium]